MALPAPKNQGTQQDADAGVIDVQDDVKTLNNTTTQARGYNELMDEYSLHQLMFRKGKLIDQTPEFVSFRRTYIEKWGPVSFILMNFEKLFTDFNVQLAYVDGRGLVGLARETLDKPTKVRLWSYAMQHAADTYSICQPEATPGNRLIKKESVFEILNQFQKILKRNVNEFAKILLP